MSTVASGKPRAELFGVLDKSTRQQPLEEVSIPQHCPWVQFFAAWGDETPTLFQGSGMLKMYGTETFNPTSKFANHATMFANIFKSNQNPQMMQRITPPDAKKALLRLSVELIKCEINKYARNEDGTIRYKTDALNQQVPVVEETFIGHRLIPHIGVEMYSDGAGINPNNERVYANAEVIRNFRSNKTLGTDGNPLATITGDDSEWFSTLYPVRDIEVSYKGSLGDDFGLRMQFPTSRGVSPVDVASVYSSLSYIQRLGIVQRNNTTGGFDLVYTAKGGVFVDVSEKIGATSDRTNRLLQIDKVFVPAYKVEQTETQPEFKGPFGQLHVYRNSLEELLKNLINPSDPDVKGEAEFNDEASLNHGRYPITADTMYLLNYLAGYDVDGAPYYSFNSENAVAFGGINITPDTIVYASGGSDGLLTTPSGEPDELANLELFDAMVRNNFKTFENGEYKWLNVAKYPISAVWDSGFSLETKKEMLNVIGKRKDIAVYLATQSQADYVTKNDGGVIRRVWSWLEPNTEAEETSIAGTLKAYASAHPESEVYGTPTCRAIIIGQCGDVIGSEYQRKLPLTYELADKVAKFMGSPDGFWRSEYAYDQDENNVIRLMNNINLSWKTEAVGRQAWDNGLTYAEDYDIRSMYFPAVRTVYTNDTSVLNSAITVTAICYAERIHAMSHRRFTGNGKFRPTKFAEQIDEFIRGRLAGRFDDRFEFDVVTRFTEEDVTNGYSWTTDTTIYAPNMVTVGKYTMIARRITDLEEEA